jgi:hypothetical protein
VCIKEQQTWPNHNIWQQQATNHVGIDLLLVASYFLWRILCSLGRTRERACYHKRVRNTNIMTTKDGNKQRTMGSIRLCTNLWIVAICVLGGGIGQCCLYAHPDEVRNFVLFKIMLGTVRAFSMEVYIWKKIQFFSKKHSL